MTSTSQTLFGWTFQKTKNTPGRPKPLKRQDSLRAVRQALKLPNENHYPDVPDVHDAVFVAIDFERPEHNNGLSSQVSIAISDTRKLELYLMSSTASGHVKCHRKASECFIFRKTANIQQDKMLSFVDNAIPRNRNIILVGHDTESSLRTLDALGFDYQKHRVGAIYDTMGDGMARAVRKCKHFASARPNTEGNVVYALGLLLCQACKHSPHNPTAKGQQRANGFRRLAHEQLRAYAENQAVKGMEVEQMKRMKRSEEKMKRLEEKVKPQLNIKMKATTDDEARKPLLRCDSKMSVTSRGSGSSGLSGKTLINMVVPVESKCMI